MSRQSDKENFSKKLLSKTDGYDRIATVAMIEQTYPGVAQLGSALDMGSRGRDVQVTRHSDQLKKPRNYVEIYVVTRIFHCFIRGSYQTETEDTLWIKTRSRVGYFNHNKFKFYFCLKYNNDNF